ncbi:MAG: phenylalanine--tRNA ligase subunit alpha [Candidatus Liptonbacteria bacterium CG11_big_fil_rev_8_21_14_0_20_35_14]|uniref:Phenylalanine--tRNA ligase alpha subunit n=1 Tax=Candidatus Liptonbacteria bacterium CG11_big_fil_rev_8_21_14_0_20_35_14 TaxID=1974634 RepID=A0A2H0NAL9_9BACT|nr:MAG: phenylalanine--tRNA ligase subunit alpha [Candidatus Liptonbacteria bacterium CG11_big_fil_rev_8_21_14_0_20_35_14]
MKDLNKIEQEVIKSLDKSLKEGDVLEIKNYYLGRKSGVITYLLKSIKDLSDGDKKKFAPQIQSLKEKTEKMIENKLKELSMSDISFKDLTLPNKKIRHGSLHPLTIVERKIVDIFTAMNFSVVDGPEIESEWYNFDALNIPEFHPAREMWDTFWIKKDYKKKDSKKRENFLMRTHTSPVQVRFMEKHKPPFQIIAPGRVFRYEATDASHEVNFHQIEGLMIGESISMANFKYIVENFLKKFFGDDITFRMRPSYFPFTEPSVEIDIKLPNSDKWLEVMGAGMVHRNVLKSAGLNHEEWQGFAFGLGVERFAMLYYGIPDIRLFYAGDLRFNRQF